MEKGKEFLKMLMLVHFFGEGKEIQEIAYDSPRF